MSESPFDTLMEVSMGFTLRRTLHVIAELGIPDALEDAPLSATALAEKTGTHPDPLNRALRVLSAHGIFAAESGEYRHSPASRLLRSDHPLSVRSFVRMQGIPALWHLWEEFDHSIRTGRSAAEKSMPDGFWGYSPLTQKMAAFSTVPVMDNDLHQVGITDRELIVEEAPRTKRDAFRWYSFGLFDHMGQIEQHATRFRVRRQHRTK